MNERNSQKKGVTAMQRIKFDVFKSFFEKDLTGKEIDFLIVLSFFQDKRGIVRGVHYKQMMEQAKMSAQSFYDCKESLEDKGLIRSVGVHGDYDITFLGNDFTGYTPEDYEAGNVKYLSTATALFRDRNFRHLKPKQKLLVMDIYNIQMAGSPRGVQAYQIGRDNFIRKYANTENLDGTCNKGLLDITPRTLQKYLKMLRLYFSVGLKDGKYFFTLRRAFGKRAETRKTEKQVEMEQILTAACRRNLIKDVDEREWKGILNILQNREKDLLNYFIDVSDVVKKMIERLNAAIDNPRKWKRRLKDTLFLQLFNEEVTA